LKLPVRVDKGRRKDPRAWPEGGSVVNEKDQFAHHKLVFFFVASIPVSVRAEFYFHEESLTVLVCVLRST
jgi:hypothetical protein